MWGHPIEYWACGTTTFYLVSLSFVGQAPQHQNLHNPNHLSYLPSWSLDIRDCVPHADMVLFFAGIRQRPAYAQRGLVQPVGVKGMDGA